MRKKLSPEEKRLRHQQGNKLWYETTRETRLAYMAKLRANPEYRERMRLYLAEYRKTRRKKLSQQSVEYQRIARRTIPTRRLKDALRAGMRSALQRGGVKKTESALKLVGCTPEEFRAHIEKQFLPGMTWENYGHDTWHLDHIKPCAAFNLHDPLERKACFHFTNIQPLWAKVNMHKGPKWGGRYNRPNQSRSRKLKNNSSLPPGT